MNSEVESSIERVGTLNEPVRRDLYRYVATRGCGVTRDEAAAAVGVSRGLAAFHLDKLVREGLLEATFRRLGDRGGPGAGRPSKLYSRSERQIQVSLPPRQYELAARVLAEAIERSRSAETLQALSETADHIGEGFGAEALSGSASGEDELTAGETLLASCGFEPFDDEDGTIRLRNCPFHALSEQHRELVCGMNLALIQGMIRGLRAEGIAAALEPSPGCCCVALRRQGERPEPQA